MRALMERKSGAKIGLLLIMAVAGCLRSVNAQGTSWRSKSFEQWSRADTEQVLNNSAWVKKQEVRIKQAEKFSAAGGAPVSAAAQGAYLPTISNTVDVGSARPPIDFVFRLRLRSGLPIRAALLREKQLEANYDQLSEKERAAFDARWNGILQCPACANNYVLTLSSSSKEQPGADAVYSVFKGGRLLDLQRYVYIANEKGERRVLVHFVPPQAPGEEAVFYFARFDDKGVPLLNSKSKELIFNLTNTDVNIITNFRIDVSQLLIDGEVSF
jgi:hypothetical protein